MRILVIDPDIDATNHLKMFFKQEGYVCDVIDTGEEGVSLSRLYDYDIIILELVLPDINGFSILNRMRNTRIHTPILILSGFHALEDKIRCLDAGADDYVTKPFNQSELLSRIQAIVRRSKGNSDSIIKSGKISVNLNNQIVKVGGETIHLTRKEYGIMELLFLRKGTTISKEMFMNHLYGGLDEPESKIIDVFVCKLRKKLDAVTEGERCIETVWGRGYMLYDSESDSNISHSMAS